MAKEKSGMDEVGGSPLTERKERVVMLARCLVAFFLRGRATHVPRSYGTIVVVLTGKLGDIVCGTPVLRAIRSELPNVRIVVAGGAVHRGVLADSGLVDEYLDLSGDGAISRIRALRAEVAIVTGPSFVPVARLYVAGVPLVVAPRVVGGYSPLQTRPYRLLTKLVRTFPYRMGAYAPRERLCALEPLGIRTDDTRKRLGYSSRGKGKAEAFFAEHGLAPGTDFLVGITPSAGHKVKEWPADRFALVADYVQTAYGAKVVLLGGPDDGQIVQNVLSHMKEPARTVNAQGIFSVDDLKAVIAQLSLFISVDTGPIYIAEAFGIPTIDITGPIDENEQPPIGPIHRNVVPPERVQPELFVLNARSHDRQEALRQIHSISVSMVTREIDALISYVQSHERRS